MSIVTAEDYNKQKLFEPTGQGSMTLKSHCSIDTRTQNDLISVYGQKLQSTHSEPASNSKENHNNRLASLLRQNHACKKERNELKFKLDRETQRNIALLRENENLRETLELYQEKVTGSELEAQRVLKKILKTEKCPPLVQGLNLIEK